MPTAGLGTASPPSSTASHTTNAMLIKPATAQRNWDVAVNANADSLDGMSTIGQLLVTPSEIPSSTLNVRITAGSYSKADGTVGSYAGIASFGLSASSTTFLWLSDSGQLNTGVAFPTTAHVRLAQVVTGAFAVQSITDQRLGPRTTGTGLGFVLKAGDAMTGTLSIVAPGTGTSVLAVDPNAHTIGFFGVTPATQATVLAPLTNSSNGSASSTIVDVGASFSQGNINNNFATLTTTVNTLIATLKRHGLMSS
jgi:hypothetical protein